MSENMSPNRRVVKRRTLRQTHLVFTTTVHNKHTVGLDVRVNKRLKSSVTTEKTETDDVPEVVTVDDSFEEATHPSVPEVIVKSEDRDLECSDIAISNDSVTELSIEDELNLIVDCHENIVTVPALKTRQQVQSDCIALGLDLDIDDSGDESDTGCASSGVDYEVESIYDSGVDPQKNRMMYSVKWKNYPEEANTWEPIGNLSHCKKLLEEFRHIRNLDDTQLMDCYHNYYKLKGVVEDICEKKLDKDVMITFLIKFKDIPLKTFNYSKASVHKLRMDLKERCVSKMDKISETTKTDKRVHEMQNLFNELVTDLNINSRFGSFQQFIDFFTKRKQSNYRLKKWEKEMNVIIEKDREGQTIKLENYVDCEVPPHNFEYISKCKTNDSRITISDDPPLYCECSDCETGEEGCCVVSNQSSIVYNRSGILKDTRHLRNPSAIYECNNKCKCSDNCLNRVVQKGRKHKIAIFRTDDDKGWGVRALEPIPKGSFVMEYIGEIITIEEADHRGAIYDAGGITYLFDLDYNEEVDGYKYALDATHSGNVSHFVNHSCDPNLDTRVVWVNNLDPFMPHIALFAIKHIKMNEELTFDYKINVQRITASANGSQISCSERSFDSGFDGSTTGAKETREAKTLAVTCRCGAHNCRQFLYSLPPSQTS